MEEEEEKIPETYEEWREHVMKRPTNPHNWQYAGDWFFPTPANSNEHWKGIFFHICEENYKNDISVEGHTSKGCKNSCDECGAPIPDGIKMIAGLLTW